jgi:hypothetical protein
LGHYLGFPHGQTKSSPKTLAAAAAAAAAVAASSSPKRDLKAAKVAGNEEVEEAAEAHDDECRAHQIFVSLQAGDAEGVYGEAAAAVADD